MFTLDQLFSSISIVTVLLVFLFTAVFQGWLDKGKLVVWSAAVLVFGLVALITYKNILEGYGQLEWNRLKMVGVQLAWGVTVGIACFNLLLYVGVSILSRFTSYNPNQRNKIWTWVVIFICLFFSLSANETHKQLITERSRIIDSVTEGLITDALMSEQASGEISR